jgi:hypothetical protein
LTGSIKLKYCFKIFLKKNETTCIKKIKNQI